MKKQTKKLQKQLKMKHKYQKNTSPEERQKILMIQINIII